MKRLKWSLLGILAVASVAMAADKYISSPGNIVLKTATSKSVNLQDSVYATQAGKVGIGTTTPAFKLEVSTSYNDGIHLKDTSGTVYGGLFTESGQLALVTRSAHAMRFGTSDSTRMTILSDGKVGIGNGTPATQLHVFGSNTLEGTGGLTLKYSPSAASVSRIAPTADSGGIYVKTDSGLVTNAPAFTINTFSSGYLDRFIVYGNGTVYMSSLAGGGTVTSSAGNLSVSSDASLKVERERSLPSLQEVLKLRPVAYQWKQGIKDLGKKKAPVEFGFMANEVAKIIPEAAPKGPNGLYGLHDRAIIVAAVNAIKEQQKIIELQKSWICKQPEAPEELCAP